MNVLRDVIGLLTRPPGDLVYFLITLFALEQGLLPTLSTSSKETRRWRGAFVGMLMGRGALIVAALLSSAGILDPASVLPPLERFVEVLTIALALWALLADAKGNAGRVFVAVAIALSFAYYAYSAITWSATTWSAGGAPRPYNGTFQELVWELVATLLLVVGLIVQLVRRREEWEWAAGVLVFWLAGHLAQLAWPAPNMHVAGWVRLGALVALPLFAALTYRRFGPEATEPSAVRAQLSLSEARALQALFRGLDEARDLAPALSATASHLAQILNAEVCAIALKERDGAQLRVTALHPGAQPIAKPTLALRSYPVLRDALTKDAPRIVHPPTREGWLQELYHVLGYREVGPLLILPLIDDHTPVGLALAGNPGSRRGWDETALGAPLLLGTLISNAVRRVREERPPVPAAGEEEIQSLREQVTKLERQLMESGAQVARLMQAAEEREPPAEDELAFWKKETRDLAQDRAVLVKERDRLIEELVELRTQGEGGQEELYRQAGLMILDGEGAIVMTDTGAHHLLDLPAGPIAGMLLPVAYPNAELAEVVDSLLAPEPYVQRRAQVGLEEGEVQATLVALPPDGAPPKFVVVELKTKEVNDVQDAVAVAANALRTPATFIRSYGDLLLTPGAGALNETQEDFVERIQANAERLLQRLDDLLLLLAPEKGRVHLTPKPMDLLTVIEGSLPGMSAWLRTQKVALRLALPDRLPTVHADPQAVRHIVRRLLSNAALCSPSGATITIGAETLADPEEDEPSHVRISVHDACGGIAPDDLEEIFYLPHAARSPRVKGVGESGAGLALAHRLAEAQEGRLTVETERGEGSTFHLTLPIYTEKPPT